MSGTLRTLLAARAAAVIGRQAERAVLLGLGGGCLLPLGAWARIHEHQLTLVAALAVDGAIRRAGATGSPDEPEALGEMVAARLR